MRDSEIAGLLHPWLGRIRDESLRRQVVAVWVLALSRSGYETVEELRKMPFTLLTDCKGISFLEHTLAVTAGAVGLAQAQQSHYGQMPYEINMDRLIAGGLLHDVGKILEIEPDGRGGYRKSRNGLLLRHPLSGAALAAEVGLPVEIINCIACHAREGEGRPQVIETVLIHQADYASFDPLAMLQKGTLIP